MASERQLEHSLQRHVVVLAILSGLLVDVSRQAVLLTPIIAICELLAVTMADRRGWFRLPRPVVNLLALAAIFPIFYRFLDSETEEQLTSIALLLTTWLCVMSFQDKSPRVYGSLLVWSLLLVVVAAVLGGGLLFGLLLVAYVVIGISALAVLHVHREELLLAEAARAGAAKEQAMQRQLRQTEMLLGSPPIAYQEIKALPSQGRLWSSGFHRQVVVVALASLLFVPGFFYVIPRRDGDWKFEHRRTRAKVGFSGEVSFEEMGRILASDELAMRVAFTDATNNQPYELFDEVYFFGKALSRYQVDSTGRATWQPMVPGDDRRRLPPIQQMLEREDREVVRQDYLLQPTRGSSIFGITPAFRGRDTVHNVRASRSHDGLVRFDTHDDDERGPFRYTVYTIGFRNGAQLPLVPYHSPGLDPRSFLEGQPRYASAGILPIPPPFSPIDRWQLSRLVPELPEAVRRRLGGGRSSETQGGMSAIERRVLTEIDRSRFPQLIAKADEIARSATENNNRIYLARLMQNYLLDTKRFTYSLDFDEINRRRNWDLDPVEDFFANHRTGHCEYFASALVMMLRSQDIPARLVVGYLGGEYNKLGRYYQVYQRDAHAWVEVYLEPDQVPPETYPPELTRFGGWYRLDPTPSSTEEEAVRGGVLRTVDQVLDYAQVLWNEYVLDMDPERQRDVGIITNSETGNEVLARMPMVANGYDALRDAVQNTREAAARAGQQETWSWRGVLLSVGLVVAGSTMLTRSGYGRWRRWKARKRIARANAAARPETPSVEFYERFELAMARLGVRRAAATTQREFAAEAEQALQARMVNVPPDAPRQIAELFYRVRFGHEQLGPSELAQAERLLQRLARG